MKTPQFKSIEEEVAHDVKWCEDRKARFPEHAAMYDRWIADHKARLTK